MESKYDLDVRGLSCPEPVVQAKKILDGGIVKKISIIADSRVSAENIRRLAYHFGLACSLTERAGEFLIVIGKEV